MSILDREKEFSASYEKLTNFFRIFTEKESISDMHVRSGERFSIRDTGNLIQMTEFPVLTAEEVMQMVRDIIYIRFTKEKTEEMMEKFIRDDIHEIDMAIQVPGTEYRARVNIFKTLGKPGFVLRKIPFKIPKLNQLGFYSTHENIIKNVTKRKEGLVLVTGQTGSGKSTTLAAIIDYINHTYDKHIVTIEDPVEFLHTSDRSLFTFREVKSDTESFYSGLKASLRQDPDIILLGEIRDEKTALAALQAAQTGHLVFATLHTNSAAETILRFIDMFPAERANMIKVSLAAALKMVISQKLAPNLAGGRVLLYEILLNNPAIQNLITKEKISDVQILTKMNESRSSEGMLPLENCIEARLKEKDSSKAISKETAMEFANRKDRMETIIKSIENGNSDSERFSSSEDEGDLDRLFEL